MKRNNPCVPGIEHFLCTAPHKFSNRVCGFLKLPHFSQEPVPFANCILFSAQFKRSGATRGRTTIHLTLSPFLPDCTVSSTKSARAHELFRCKTIVKTGVRSARIQSSQRPVRTFALERGWARHARFRPPATREHIVAVVPSIGQPQNISDVRTTGPKVSRNLRNKIYALLSRDVRS